MNPASIPANVKRVRAAIRDACARRGRLPEDVLLVAVSKAVETYRIREAIATDVRTLGENRVQEAKKKIEAIGHSVSWHLIGSLQTNKAKDAVHLFDWIHSLDRLELAKELDRRASAIGKNMNVLVEVNLRDDRERAGIRPDQLETFLTAIRSLKGLRIRGLMTIPPMARDPNESRPYFRRLREIRDSSGLEHLSMGMSNDFEIAVEEGATMVRVGTAIFGPRATGYV